MLSAIAVELVKLNVQLVPLVQEMTVTSLMLTLAPIVDLALEFAQLVHQIQPNKSTKEESPQKTLLLHFTG